MSLNKVSEDSLVVAANDVNIQGSFDGGFTWVALHTTDTGEVVVAGMIDFSYDNVDIGYPSATQETYTFSKGGTDVAIITVTYTDSSKENLSNIAKTLI